MKICSLIVWPCGVVLALGVALLLLAGCSGGSGSATATLPADPADANFILFVSNQSFADSPVDIRITIDGQTVVDQNFDVDNQHSWKRFPLQLTMGEHRLEAVSKRGPTTLTKKFWLVGKQWAVVDYWYYPTVEGGAGPTPRHFSFKQFDRPPGFQ